MTGINIGALIPPSPSRIIEAPTTSSAELCIGVFADCQAVAGFLTMAEKLDIILQYLFDGPRLSGFRIDGLVFLPEPSCVSCFRSPGCSLSQLQTSVKRKERRGRLSRAVAKAKVFDFDLLAGKLLRLRG